MDKHSHENSIGAAHAIQAAPPVSVLDSLMTPTFKDLKAAHYRIAAETREGRERAGTEFRVGGSQASMLICPTPTQPSACWPTRMLCSAALAAMSARPWKPSGERFLCCG